MSEWFADLRSSVRAVLQHRVLSVVVLVTLTIGIAANVAIFSFVYGTLLQPLPYAEPDRIVRLNETHDGHGSGISTLTYLDWKNQNEVFDLVAADHNKPVTLTGVNEPVQLRCNHISAELFEVFGIRAALGRIFLPGEDQPGRAKVVVMSDALWRSQFGADPDIIGRSILLDREPHTVVGVLAGGTAIDRSYHQIWRPLVFTPEDRTRNYHWLFAVARLKRGVSIEQARANMNAIAARIATEHPETNKSWGVQVTPFADQVVNRELKHSLRLLMAAVGAVLLIVCVNVASVFLTRGLARQREVAIRLSLGASRARLIRQFATEGAVLCFAGTSLGLALGHVLMRAMNAALPAHTIPAEAEIALNGPVLLFTLGLTAVTTLGCAVIPAWQATRGGPADALRNRSIHTTDGKAQTRLQGSFVVIQVALALALLITASLLVQTVQKMNRVTLGVDATNLLTARLPMASERFPTPDTFTAYLAQIGERVAALPGVRDVAFTATLPLQRGGFGMGVQIAGDPVAPKADRPFTFFKPVGTSYFQTMRMPLLQGRALSSRDVRGSPPVAVISAAFARKYFPHRNPIGQRVIVAAVPFGQMGLGPDVAWEVVGVVSDERVGGLGNETWEPIVYASLEQAPQLVSQMLVVRGDAGVSRLAPEVRRAVHAINPDQVLTHVMTMEDVKAESLGPTRFQSMLLAGFALVATLLAAFGIYGTLAYAVERRTRELGIRAALGATGRQLIGHVRSRGLKLVATGLALGIGLALSLRTVIAGFLFGTEPHDPFAFASAVLILSAVAWLACTLPARRAARADPLVCLRAE